jgi:hypothetical protein
VIPRPTIVLLGMMSRHPVAGIVWLTMQYVVGLDRLGYDVYYVETVGDPRFVAGVMRRFGFEERWAIDARAYEGRAYGLSKRRLAAVYKAADVMINLHGGTKPLEEHRRAPRLVYLETDPVELEADLHEGAAASWEFLLRHNAFFSWAENYSSPDCRLPLPDEPRFLPTRQPIVLDFWQPHNAARRDAFTTIGNWKQLYRDVVIDGETYAWSKHLEFLKVIDLPRRTDASFELALASYEDDDRKLLERHGWSVRDAAPLSTDLDAYRGYVVESLGEFTVAKDQNVRLRTGWLGDRAGAYLAAGRPVITQDTGFGNVLPTGEGLLAFRTLDDAVAAVESVLSDYERHSRAAAEIAREHFAYDVVLPRLLEAVGSGVRPIPR